MQITAPTQSAQVHYTVAVLAASGRVCRRLPRRRNLILDQGLDGIAGRSWVQSFTHAVVGTGTTPTKRDSGAITFSRAGSTVTASAGFFESADVGRLLKFDSGEEVRITAYTDAQTVTTSTAGAIAAAEGTVWYVNQTGLTAEIKRTNAYSTDSGANGSSFLAGTWTHKRTFIFTAETGTVVYREIGWSHTDSAGLNLFGRDLLPGGGVSLVSGQQLRVTVELAVSYSPASAVAYSNVIAGWTQDGTCGVEWSDIHTVSASGASSTTAHGLEPSGLKRVQLSTSSSAISPMSASAAPGAGGIGYVDADATGYASGSFARSYNATFGVSVGNSTNIRSLNFGRRDGATGTTFPAFRVLLNGPETKTSAQTLTLTFALSWGRVLNNA